MRVLRWILGIAGAVVLLAVAAALIAALVINPDRYRGAIERIARRETGRPLVLEGHLRVTWFPWLGVHTGPGRLGNPPGTGGPDLLDWRSAQVRVRLLPLLLHRQIEIGRIRIAGADIHLRRGPHGRGNWDDLLARLRNGSRTPAAAASSAHPAVTLGGLDLVNGSLDYVDARSREHVRLADWRLEVGPYRSGAPLSVRTRFVLRLERPAGNASTAGGAWHLPAAGVRVSLEVPRLRAQASPLRVAAPGWSLSVADANARGAIDVARDSAGRLTGSGSLELAAPSLRGLALALGMRMPALEDPAALGALSLSGSWRYRRGALTIRPLTARLDSTTITGSVGWGPPQESRAAGGSAPRNLWTFALRANHVDFGRYLTRSRRRKPLHLPVSALRALHARGTVEVQRARIGGTTLTHVRLQVH